MAFSMVMRVIDDFGRKKPNWVLFHETSHLSSPQFLFLNHVLKWGGFQNEECVSSILELFISSLKMCETDSSFCLPWCTMYINWGGWSHYNEELIWAVSNKRWTRIPKYRIRSSNRTRLLAYKPVCRDSSRDARIRSGPTLLLSWGKQRLR